MPPPRGLATDCNVEFKLNVALHLTDFDTAGHNVRLYTQIHI